VRSDRDETLRLRRWNSRSERIEIDLKTALKAEHWK